jgi:hypothetical protein
MSKPLSVVLLLLCSVNLVAQSTAPPPPVGGITVEQIIRLSHSGLSDTVIIAQIQKRRAPFSLSPDELVRLKEERVSDRVIAAMTAVPPNLAIANPEPRPASVHSSGPKVLPTNPGMYVITSSGSKKVIGQVVTFARTGSLFVSAITIGIKARHGNVQFPGPHAQTVVEGVPSFYFVPVKDEADAGVDAGDLVLIKFEEKPQRRQFEVNAAGNWRASSGISITHQLELVRSEEDFGVYKVTPVHPLPKGEYCLYLKRNQGLSAYVYDFSSNGQYVK